MVHKFFSIFNNSRKNSLLLRQKVVTGIGQHFANSANLWVFYNEIFNSILKVNWTSSFHCLVFWQKQWSINFLDSQTKSVSQSVVEQFPQVSLSLPAVTATDSKTLFVCACQSDPPCAGALPNELCHWLCSQVLLLSSGIAINNDSQMTNRGSNLD